MTQFTKQVTSSRKQKALAVLYIVARYYAAFTLLGYGFAKLMGAQFTVLDSQLAKPMGEVSGFWLTWYYFGVSPVYSGLIAGSQILGAIFLCFRRTALIGILVLLPVMINIICVDHWIIHWGIESDAFRIALYVLVALIVALCFHAKDLYRFLLKRRDDLALLDVPHRWVTVAQISVVLGMVLYTAYEGYWLANVNNRAPTAIDGAWHLVQTQNAKLDLPEWVYFEYNRAHMVVFKFPDGKSAVHDFRVDPQLHTLEISQQWLSPGSDVLRGTWTRTGDELRIEGKWNATVPVSMTLQRKEMPVKDHQ